MSFLIASPCLQVKTAWLVDLENLVERISDKFSAHFASMGFAGQVSVYESFSDVGEIRVYFASKILTPCRMH